MCFVAFNTSGSKEISDKEVIERARKLGMVEEKSSVKDLFVSDKKDKDSAKEKKTEDSSSEKKKNDKVDDGTLRIGDKVMHKIFGKGIVVKADGLKITVAFGAEYGIKVLMSNHPSITRI